MKLGDALDMACRIASDRRTVEPLTGLVVVAALGSQPMPVRLATILDHRRCGCGDIDYRVRYACGTEATVHGYWLFSDTMGGPDDAGLAQLSPRAGRA